MNEIQEVKEKLAFKIAWCRVLQKNLGISRWQRITIEMSEKVNELSNNLQQALETTEAKITSGSAKSVQRAKLSFETFSTGT
jgi:predicted component of type VI protein secretion system